MMASKQGCKQCRIQNSLKFGFANVVHEQGGEFIICLLDLKDTQNVCLLLFYLQLFCYHYQSK